MPGTKKTVCDPNWFVEEINPDIAGWLKPVENDSSRVFCIIAYHAKKLLSFQIWVSAQ